MATTMYSGTFATGYDSTYGNHTFENIQSQMKVLQEQQRQANELLKMRMGNWGQSVSPVSNPIPMDKIRFAKKEPEDCGHIKIPKHLKSYYHQLVEYYCQQDPDVKQMRDVQYKKPCCILNYVKG